MPIREHILCSSGYASFLQLFVKDYVLILMNAELWHHVSFFLFLLTSIVMHVLVVRTLSYIFYFSIVYHNDFPKGLISL